ncbi:MAG TPA: hypothetical protein VG674_32670 [Amycolatopsis sp.]|jgi:hypothetical protein|nr:hypothetical protein [Amycolatopsis sp.]
MAEHAEQASDTDSKPRPKRADIDWRRTREQGFSFVATLVRWVGVIFALILVLYVIFVVGSANPANGIVSFVHSWADGLSLGFKDLFTPSDAKLRVLVNYGIAAIFWLVVSGIVAKIIRRIGGVGS